MDRGTRNAAIIFFVIVAILIAMYFIGGATEQVGGSP